MKKGLFLISILCITAILLSSCKIRLPFRVPDVSSPNSEISVTFQTKPIIFRDRYGNTLVDNSDFISAEVSSNMTDSSEQDVYSV